MFWKRDVLRVCTTLFLAASCRWADEEQALARIAESRERLASLARHGRSGFGEQSIVQARRVLLEAESAVRRSRPRLPFGEKPWEASLQRAQDSVAIAEWVVERERAAKEGESEAWIESADRAVRAGKTSRVRRVHYAVDTRLRQAEMALAEARRLMAHGELHMASDKAQEAIALAGELPPEIKALFERFGDPANLRQWREWVRTAIRESKRPGGRALVVDKRAQLAVLWVEGRPVRWLDVELGYNGLKQKLQSGDGATPEGLYRVTRKKGTKETRYYKALLLSYPNDADRRRFREARMNGEVSRSSSIGGLIEIHGEGGRGQNWTDGCVAVTNDEMDDLFEKLSVGSPVAIVGNAEQMNATGGAR
ncbi:MAG TPA: L,D-transpeptidase [Vicinamibacteria bacterium]|nr:L,D-transpeptidase [Vicinamibacteria bacterium]